MHAVNVFSEGDDEFAELEVITGPAVQFTDGINYGDGDQLNPANGTFFAATQLKVDAAEAAFPPSEQPRDGQAETQ